MSLLPDVAEPVCTAIYAVGLDWWAGVETVVNTKHWRCRVYSRSSLRSRDELRYWCRGSRGDLPPYLGTYFDC